MACKMIKNLALKMMRKSAGFVLNQTIRERQEKFLRND
jgi:hypothetical protein